MSEQSNALDIVDDLTEEQLAEAAFTQDIVVYWTDHKQKLHGIIFGYDEGIFHIDVVAEGSWQELVPSQTWHLRRNEFTVFGPANRDPGDDQAVRIDEAMTAADLRNVVGDKTVLISYDGGTKFGIVGEDFKGDRFRIRLLAGPGGPLTDEWVGMDRHHFVVLGEWPGEGQLVQSTKRSAGTELHGFDTLSQIPPDARLDQFVDAMRALLTVGMGDFLSGEPTFRVRLDVDARAARSGEEHGPAYPRQFRILVRPVMEPIMHDELVAILGIAEHYELAAFHGQHGIELRQPDDVM